MSSVEKVLGHHATETSCRAVQVLLAAIQVGTVARERDSARIHPFPARMPQSLAQTIIEAVSKPGDLVLDPMCGSGTTLIAAKRVDRQAIGVDRDPLALLVSRASVGDQWPLDVIVAGERILDRAKRLRENPRPRHRDILRSASSEFKAFVTYWFPPQAILELQALRMATAEENDSHVKLLADVTFSSLIVAKSAGVTYAMDIARSRPHKVVGRDITTPFAIWSKRFATVVARRPFCVPAGPAAVVIEGDARHLPVATGKVDLVLTSPPYLNAIDYLRGHKFSLVWFGHDLKALRQLRGGMVGTERGLWTRDGLPAELEQRLATRLEPGRRQALVRRYISDLGYSLGEIARVLKPKGLAVLVLGPTVINAQRTDAAKVMELLGSQHGLRTLGHAERSLPAGWRSLPPPGKVGPSNPVGSRMRREVVIVLQKP